MLPSLDEDGYLPPGVHRCTFEELKDRFGQGSDERETAIDELQKYCTEAFGIGTRRLVVGGSFVTDKEPPGDVDLIVLVPVGYDWSSLILEPDPQKWPMLQMILVVDERSFESWTSGFFLFERNGRPRGIVEVIS